MAKARNKQHTPSKPRSAPEPWHRTADRVSAALAAAGVLITAYLSYVAVSGSAPLLCTTGSSCDLIQQSHWSRLFGIPVALWGFAIYALILIAALVPSNRLRRWRRIWLLSLLGLVFSLYLTAVGIISLQAVCGWCLASLALLLALFVVATVRRPPGAPGMPWLNWSMGSAGLLLCVLGVAHAAYSGLFSPRPQPQLVALAEHLKETGAQFYGASWCPACQRQKALFGGAADNLPYVECSPSGRGGPFAMACLNADIRDFPTWIIRGRRYVELLQPDELAQRSGFVWSAPADTPEPNP